MKKQMIFILTAFILILAFTACAGAIPGNTPEVMVTTDISGSKAEIMESNIVVESVLPFPVTPGKLVGISYSFGSINGGEWNYQIFERNGSLFFSGKGFNGVDLDVEIGISDKVLEEFEEIIDSYGIRDWHGFNKQALDVMDGHSFDLVVNYENGSLTASGYMFYPDGYETGHKALFDCFEKIAGSQTDKSN